MTPYENIKVDLRKTAIEWMRRIVNNNDIHPAIDKLIENDLVCSRAEGRRVYYKLREGKNESIR